MSVFEYKAIDAKGKKSTGFIESDTEKSARQQLQSQQLTLLEVNASNRKPSQTKSWFEPKLSVADTTVITRQLASLLQASMPIDEALQTIGQNSSKKHIRKIVGQIRSSVIEGKSLAESLTLNAKQLPLYFISSVEAGERTGELGQVLGKLADEIQNQEKFKKKIAAALIYPIMISIVAIIVVTSLLIFVVPQIVSIFDDSDQTLPPLTIAVIAASDFLTNNIELIISLLIALYIATKLAFRQENIKIAWQQLLGKTPVIGYLLINANAARFSRTFALLHESGTPVLVALTNAANALSYLPMKQAVLIATEKVREGSTIFKALQMQNALPSLSLYMLASGEASGQLSEMLNKSAEDQEADLDNYTTKIISLFEPLMILLMGGIVLLIVLAILLPIFELNQIDL
ncbi:General secretion pathway protein F [hydrothermal vent metagenome]|uniref:General secretion pathway protein F n=1 Tax=hydrothermal vent metagenome TaxID=652676 RepID=A0A1W1DZZ5_9ZZZZ|nr:type II secretion system protein GspF [Gammaproteobacteria bacterium]